jgi:hypothetical protein
MAGNATVAGPCGGSDGGGRVGPGARCWLDVGADAGPGFRACRLVGRSGRQPVGVGGERQAWSPFKRFVTWLQTV